MPIPAGYARSGGIYFTPAKVMRQLDFEGSIYMCVYAILQVGKGHTTRGNDLFVLFECFSVVQSCTLIATHVFSEGK